MGKKYLWGIDLGGTKIEGVVLEVGQRPEVVARLRVPTEKEAGYDHIIGQVGFLIGLLRQKTGLVPTHIGMGTPGAIDPPTGLMKNSNTTAINGRPFQKDLEASTGLAFTLANDANCFAIAETLRGVVKEKAPEARMVFGVIMGTGVGGGLVIDGKVWEGKQGIGGEWGHSYLDSSGGLCYCGNRGCVETIISGPALENYYHELSGTRASLPEIMARYQKGRDQAAVATADRLLHYFGKALANLINTLDPDAVVLGGGVGNIDLLYQEGVQRIRQFLFNPRLDTPILKPRLGDSAGVFGAAFLTL